MSWQPLSVRRGLRDPDGPYEGIPDHMQFQLNEWLVAAFTLPGGDAASFLGRMAARLRIPLSPKFNELGVKRELLHVGLQDGPIALDILDYLLAEHPAPGSLPRALELILSEASSAWMVRPDGKGLVERVPTSVADDLALATAPEDQASLELQEAWGAAYGRAPDASDAWDHAIKAAEAVLVPLVSPNNTRATLGSVIANLRDQQAQWELELRGAQGTGPIAPLISMLGHMWPNPDRHAGQGTRTPSLVESRAIVHLAVTVVQWIRSGVLRRR